MRAKWILSAYAGGLFLLAGCSTPVHTDYKSGADFSKYRSFALLPLPQRASADDPGLIMRLGQTARDAVTTALTAKGMMAVPADQADLAINLRGQSLPRVEVSNYGYSYPVMTRYGTVTAVYNPYTSVSTYNERTLIIEMFDTHTKEMVWVGWTKKKMSGQVAAEDLQEAISNILAKYPPAPAATPGAPASGT